MHPRYLVALGLLGALWGSAFLFIKIGVEEITPALFVAVRLIIAALLIIGVLHASGLRLPTNLRTWSDFLFTGAIGVALPFFLITWGEQHIPSGLAAIIIATTPLFTMLLSYVIARDERLSGMRLVGVLCGFAGVVVAVGLERVQLGSGSVQGYLATLGAALCYGISGLYSRRAFRGMPALLPATGQITGGALVMAPFAFGIYSLPHTLPSARVIGALLALTILCTTFAYVINFWLLERIGATRTSMVSYLIPPIALFYGAVFLGEAISSTAIVGLLLVLVGIMLANGLIVLRAFAAKSPRQTEAADKRG